mmetsp:Transcript_36845/g.36479  ORF Transcript_36845/g.36479 Transcript_36845/m.36479 type:complete len:84 (+) Transcript_36845:1342-1593(+)
MIHHEIGKDINKDIKNSNIQKNKEIQNRANILKRKNDSSDKRDFYIYKPLMKRSKRESIKKKVDNENKLSEEDLDKIYFLGLY